MEACKKILTKQFI